jgi:hypothetical protein
MANGNEKQKLNSNWPWWVTEVEGPLERYLLKER